MCPHGARALRVSLILIVVVSACSSEPGVLRFGKVFDGSGLFTAGEAPLLTMAVDDLDEDGRKEILVTSCGAPGTCPTLHILESRGGDGFTDIFDAPVASLHGAGTARSLAAGDLDRDGRRDLLVASVGGKMAIVSSTGPDRFVQWPVGIRGLEVNRRLVEAAVADTNQNGEAEIVLAYNDLPVQNHFRAALFVYEHTGGPGDLTFEAILQAVQLPLPGTSSVSSIAIGDSDNDGRQEIILGETALGTSIFRIDRFEYDPATQSYERKVDEHPELTGLPVRPLVADLDGDGRNELLYTAQLASQGAAFVVFEASRDDTYYLAFRSPDALSQSPINPSVGEVAGSKHPLIVLPTTAGVGALRFFTFVGEPQRYAERPAEVPAVASPVVTTVLTDLTGDGKTDLVVAGGGHQVEVLAGR